ncbi:solute carrier family 35 member G1-like isoform X2 [Apostichopus japonicus]|uniref:solute carrier family 35 member G1-like isoform X2 n=1 Tax=Stichopus japonicus TaxID=307972 RepID=UPI003AB5CEA9
MLDHRQRSKRISFADQPGERQQSQPTGPDSVLGESHDVEIPPTLRTRIYRHRGVLFVLIASLLSSFHYIIVKVVKDDVHAMEVSFLRFFLQLALPVPLMTYRGISPRPESPKVLLLLVSRSLLGMVALISFFYALYLTRAGDATAILYGSPVLVGVFGRVFLKEAFGIIDGLLVGVVIGGVLLISQPPFLFGGGEDGGDVSDQFVGAMFSFLACVCISITTVTISKLGQLRVSSIKIVLYYATIASLGTALLATAIDAWSIPKCGWVRIALVGMGILNCLAQILITYSLSLEKSVFVAIQRTNEVWFVYLLEFFIFGVSPNLWAFLGVILVLSASITASLKKMWISKKKGLAKARRLSQMSSRISEEPTEMLETLPEH